MRFITIAALAGSVAAYPGMKGSHTHGSFIKDIMQNVAEKTKRQGPPPQPVVVLGDLSEAITTTSGATINTCLNDQSGASCLADGIGYNAPDLKSSACAADTCCVWDYIKTDLVPLFTDASGCSPLARAAVRFGFHDAGAWDIHQTSGGADGSILLSETEYLRTENAGLSGIRTTLFGIYNKYKTDFDISAADLVQFAHNVAVVVCPLGPRQLTFVGRPDATEDAPTGLLPDANSPAEVLLELFTNKTIYDADLVALIGAHTTANQFFFDPSQAGKPLDSTPGVWDVLFYNEVLSGAPPAGVFRLPSDDFLGNDTTTVGGFNAFAGANGQAIWNALYAHGYLRLSLLGVQGIQELTDCSHVLPGGVAPAVSSSSSSVIPSSTASSFSSFSFFGNHSATASSYGGKGPHASTSSGHGGKGASATSSGHGGKGASATSSGHGGKGASATASFSAKGGDKGVSEGGAWPTASASYSAGGKGSGSWGTTTAYSSKCHTLTKDGSTTLSWETVPYTTTVWAYDPATSSAAWGWADPTVTDVITKTHTITLQGGKVTTSTETATVTYPAWSAGPSVTAAPVKPLSCIVKTVSITTTVWA